MAGWHWEQPEFEHGQRIAGGEGSLGKCAQDTQDEEEGNEMRREQFSKLLHTFYHEYPKWTTGHVSIDSIISPVFRLIESSAMKRHGAFAILPQAFPLCFDSSTQES